MSKQELIKKIAKEWINAESVIRAVDLEGWLHDPDQVPGRATITVAQLRAGMKVEGIAEGEEYEQFWTETLGNFGITVVPDPEPTNKARLQAEIEAWEDSRDPCRLSEWLDKAGVKAPEADDE